MSRLVLPALVVIFVARSEAVHVTENSWNRHDVEKLVTARMGET